MLQAELQAELICVCVGEWDIMGHWPLKRAHLAISLFMRAI